MEVTQDSDSRPRCCKVPRPKSESTYREPTTTQWCRRCQTGSPRVRRCKLPQSGAERAEKRNSSADQLVVSSGEVNTRGNKQCCSCLERSDDPEQTSSGDTPSTRAARGGGECVVLGDHQSTRSTWKSVRRRSDAVERTQLQLKPTVWANMARLDDAGEKKLEERTHSG